MVGNSRTKKAIRNILTGLGNKIFLLFLTLISRKFFIEYIGVEYLGINGLFSNILMLLSMADLGFGVAMSYSFYKPLEENDTRKISALITLYRKIYNIIAVAVAILGLLMIPFLKYIVNLENNIEHLTLYYVVFLANTVFSYLMSYKQTILTADQKSYIVNNIKSVVNLLMVIAQILVVVIFHNYLLYIILQVVATIFNNLVLSYVASKKYPYIKEKKQLEKKESLDIFNNMWSVFLYKFASTIMTSTDNIIISALLGTAIVGLYSNYLTITNNISQFIIIIFSSITASIGNLMVSSTAKSQFKVFKMLQMSSFVMSGIITVCLLTLFQDFIVVWIGTEYLLDDFTVYAIAFNTFFSVSMQPVWSYREASGLYCKTKYVMICTAIVNLILSILMGYMVGLWGIIVATTLSRVLTYFWYEPKLLYKIYFKEKVRVYYIDYAIEVIMIICSTIICQKLFAGMVVENFVQWVVKAIGCVGITGGVFLIRYIKTEEFNYFLNKILTLSKKEARNG